MDSLSDTPETDAEAVCRAGPGEWLEVVTTDFAKELERSRNEWRRQATENEHKRWLLEQILADVQTRLCGAVESEQRAYIAGLEKAAEICEATSYVLSQENLPHPARTMRIECAQRIRAHAESVKGKR